MLKTTGGGGGGGGGGQEKRLNLEENVIRIHKCHKQHNAIHSDC